MHIDFVEIENFRKLRGVRVGFSSEKTVFVGANNSGKTSAMVALRKFLIEKERRSFSLNDFTLSHWPAIDKMGREWEADGSYFPDWSQVAPSIDIWLSVQEREAHFVQKLIPTLDWNGGSLGVRLRVEPIDPLQLQKEFTTARMEAMALQEAVVQGAPEGTSHGIKLWPKTLSEFLQRRMSRLFTVRSYVLDPSKLAAPVHGAAQPQKIEPTAHAIDGNPLKGLIRIDEIGAQRGFGQTDGTDDNDDEGAAAGASATRKMSEQMRRYWNKHLDPFDSPNVEDLGALVAIESAQKAFDDRLRIGFASALEEVEKLGYPGITDPRLSFSTRLKPVDGLNDLPLVFHPAKTGARWSFTPVGAG